MADAINVGAIAVEILARTEKLEAGLKGAKGQIGAFSGALAGVTAGVTNFALQMGTAAAGAMAGFIKNSFVAIGAAQDLAMSLNSDTQALLGLQYAAKNTGADAATLNIALTKMNANIGQGLAGNKNAAEGFDRLGLRIEDLAKMASTDAFSLIAEKIKALPTPAQQAQAAMDIFGKSASSLLPLLSEGAAGIAELQERYVMLSGGMSELDVSKVQLAGDLVDDLWTIVTGAANAFAVELSPFISAASTKLIEMGFNGKNAIKFVGEGFNWLQGILREVATWTVRVYQGWLSLSYLVQGIEWLSTKQWSLLEQAFNWLSEKVKSFSGGAIDLGSSSFFQSWNDQSSKAMDQTASEIMKLETMLEKDAPAAWVDSIFEQVKLGADEAAKGLEQKARERRKFAQNADTEREDNTKQKAAKANSNSFREINMSLINPNALGIGKDVDKQQLDQQKKQTGLLTKLVQNTGAGAGGAVYA